MPKFYLIELDSQKELSQTIVLPNSQPLDPLSKENECDHCTVGKRALCTHVCRECLVQLCSDHASAHISSRNYCKHSLISPKDFAALPDNAKLRRKMEQNRQLLLFVETCQEHGPVNADKWCLDCQLFVCQECSFSKMHVGHQFSLASEFLPELVGNFETTSLVEGRTALSALQNKSEQVQQWKSELAQNHAQNITELQLERDKAYARIAIQFAASKAALDAAFEKTSEALQGKQEELDKVIDELQTTIKNSEHTIKTSYMSSLSYDEDEGLETEDVQSSKKTDEKSNPFELPKKLGKSQEEISSAVSYEALPLDSPLASPEVGYPTTLSKEPVTPSANYVSIWKPILEKIAANFSDYPKSPANYSLAVSADLPKVQLNVRESPADNVSYTPIKSIAA